MEPSRKFLSFILWAMMTFPGLPDSEVRQFEQEREAAVAAVSDFGVQAYEGADGETRLTAKARSLKERLSIINSREAEASLRHSIAGRIGIALETVTQWAGFDWRTNIALVGGFAAKEVVVSTLGTSYSLGKVNPEELGTLSQTLAKVPNWSPLVALSLIIFTMFYAPCFVAVVCIAREAGSWKWGAFSMVFNTLLAFVLATLVFQIGSAIG